MSRDDTRPTERDDTRPTERDDARPTSRDGTPPVRTDGGTGQRRSLLADPRVRGVLGTGGFFLAVQVLALAVTPRLASRGISYGDGGGAALLPLVAGLALGTLLALAVARWGLSPTFLRGLTVVSVGVSVWFAAAAFLGPILGLFPAALGTVAVWRTRRWTVRNTVAAVGVAGAAGVFGASLTPVYAAVALAVVAVYDGYSVYYSGHMIELADASARLELPTAFVVPTDGAGGDGGEASETGEATETTVVVADGEQAEPASGGPRVAMLGTGDALFPALLAASVQAHHATIQVVGGGPPLGLAPEAIGAALGGIAGFLLLQAVVHRRGGVHAGLPLINGGAVAGWLLLGGAGLV
ncbi:MAG: presenilin family intramembrane aspartyl protease PSH [Halobaculum sp.]